MEFAKRGASIFSSGDLHEPVKHKECPAKSLVGKGGGLRELGRVGVDEGDRGRGAFDGEAAGLIEELLGEVERRDVAIADLPES